ncbi:pseudo-response regulator 9 [Arabis alpina]|uniref:Pseudo-response regulator 9 n=1 Tax=Arabis alpina TaxID=50452 RepID=A0A087H5P2_ARAAL|nr:pseudo-response regulator 9 [Arabis alpina]
MGEIVVLSSDEGEETMMNRGKSSEVVRWEKYLPKTVIRVLLVESDDSTRQIITALLRKCCYKVVAVCDGLAAWEILKEKSCNIDLILTELDLPSISGFALLALVMEHEVCKNIPMIMISSQDSITLVLKCMLRGAADYLIKPMRKNELKNLWQHVWRRLTLRDDPTAHAHSLPGSQHNNLEDTDETSSDSRYHSDQGSGAQANYNGHNKLVTDVKSFDVTMDLLGGIDKQPDSFYGNNTRDDYVGPELGLSLKRSCSESFEKQDESKQQKLSLSDASAFAQYENSKPAEKAVEANSSAEPRTPSESHEKLRTVRSDLGSATTSINQENIGSSSVSGQNQVLQSPVTNPKQLLGPQESLFPEGSNLLKASKELEVGSQSTCNTNEGITGQSSSSTEKPKEEESINEKQQRWSQREAALMKFRLKRKDRCFDKKVRYQSRKKLAEQRPRVKGQFVRAANSDTSTKA